MYTVKYKRVGDVFWNKLKKVKGDGFIENGYVPGPNNTAIGTTKNIRWFILEDETRVEIHCENMMFKFSPERFILTCKQVNKQAGQKII